MLKPYQRIIGGIEAKIRNEELQEGDRLPSESELAREHQVSASTVKAGLKELELMGTIFRHQGKGTFVKSSHTTPIQLLCILPPMGTVTSFQLIFQYLEALAQQNHMLINYVNVNTDPEILERTINNLPRAHNRHAVFAPSPKLTDRQNAWIYSLLGTRCQSVIVIDSELPGKTGYPYIASESRGSAFQLAEMLVQNNYDRYVFVHVPSISHSSAQVLRRQGFDEAMESYGISAERITILTKGQNAADICRELADMVRQGQRVGVCAVNDWLAFELLNHFLAAGVAIPASLGLTGFDGLDIPQPLTLTTALHDYPRIAAALLAALSSPAPTRQIVKATIIRGETT